ncbi:hypothetical protein HW450_06595 [Corynebacterium hindlerae]|uniref:Uncharacterized protein n=1 Tax=Corynebacterium hindlerae TaxID=699041 RepID=A0A7G5FIB8_9CORY|nr:hypothetical protein [Corynebacterium hindlerae]QMV86359.1 hypothetical protein HW450_06595 [Corynebacterium hindlerae]
MTYAWRVERDRNAYSGELMPGWVVKSLEDGALPSYKVWWTHGHFDTWQQAMAKADKESRTRTVTLPADPRHAGRFSLRVKHHAYGTVIKIQSLKSTQNLVVIKEEAEALALALLTHAKDSGNK